MRKVLKTAVKTMALGEDKKQSVVLRFQYNKDWKPPEEGAIKVYRRRDEGFVFDWDEMEYFDLMIPKEDELIFEGELEVKGTFAEFVDGDVEIGEVYIYWIVKGDSSPAGPFAVKVRDSEIWWSYDRLVSEIEELKKDFPEVRVEVIGKTVMGKPLYALHAGNEEKLIGAVGTVHAGESGPELLLPALRRILTECPEMLKKCGIAVIPTVSADMREKMAEGLPPYVRKNAAGVDLNRNFDALWQIHDESYGLSSYDPMSPTYHGPTPASEPEVQAVVKVMEEVKPLAVFSFHHLCSITSDRCLTAHECEGDTAFLERANKLTKIYSDAFRAELGLNKNEDTDAVLGCSVGSLPSYLYKSGIPCFDLEMSSTTECFFDAKLDKTTREMLEKCRRAHTAALKAIIGYFAE